MRNFSYIIVIAALAVVACKKGDKTQTSQNTATEQTAPIELPKTPEAVVRTWEAQVGQNQFALAKLISTGKTLATVISLDSTHNIQSIPSSTTNILSIDCAEKGEKATCDCLLQDEIGKIQCKYFLLRQNGQWFLQDAESEPVEDVPALVNQKPTKTATK